MLIDYSYANQAFVDGLKAFLDYSTPNPSRDGMKEGLMLRRRLSKEAFEKRCIQRWAISELINSIIDNPYDPVEETTYKLALKFLHFAQTAATASAKMVFCIAGNFLDKEVINVFRNREGIYP